MPILRTSLRHRPRRRRAGSQNRSSGRLFLDRVGRHQSPSPLHRHVQINMHFSETQTKGPFLLCREGDISTLPRQGFIVGIHRRDSIFSLKNEPGGESKRLAVKPPFRYGFCPTREHSRCRPTGGSPCLKCRCFWVFFSRKVLTLTFVLPVSHSP